MFVVGFVKLIWGENSIDSVKFSLNCSNFITSITKFGAFVRILPGVDGLVHISEISNERVEKVSDVLKVGDMVDVKLLDVDFDKKRISLSMKALLKDDEQ